MLASGSISIYLTTSAVTATLIELNSGLVAEGQATCAALHLEHNVRFLCRDATKTRSYAEITPARIVCVCGVFGNVLPQHVRPFILNLRSVCQQAGMIIWTRRCICAADHEMITQIRTCFLEAGFENISHDYTNPEGFLVSTHQFKGETTPLPESETFFVFTDYESG